MILVNGALGIGTGYSTTIPMYDVHQIIETMLHKLNHNEYLEINPSWDGFIGDIEKIDENNYIVSG
jgi:DNA topoisomerase-2